MQRVGTGIKGLDKIVGGGFPEGSFTVVSGGPGTGKTIFGLQFLAEGALKGEKGLLISTEQPKEEILDQAMQFGWDLKKLEKEKKLKIVEIDSANLFHVSSVDKFDKLLKGNYKRLVVDSLTSFVFSTADSSSIVSFAREGYTPGMMNEMSRANAATIIDLVKNYGITALGLSQKVEGMPGDTIDMVSEFRGDGLITFNLSSVGKQENRVLQVKKMRKTKINSVPYSIKFGKNGIVVTK